VIDCVQVTWPMAAVPIAFLAFMAFLMWVGIKS